MEAVLRAACGKMCIMGNVDPIEVLLRGAVEDVVREVERIMAIGRQGTGFMLDSGEMIPRDVPEENMHAMMRRGHQLARL
jgi:uroporphyrinogen decarboxylase